MGSNNSHHTANIGALQCDLFLCYEKILCFLGMSADELSSAINHDGEEGVEYFEKLFSKLQLMKGCTLNYVIEIS